MLLGDSCAKALEKAEQFTDTRRLSTKNNLMTDDYYHMISNVILLFGCIEEKGYHEKAIVDALSTSRIEDDDSGGASADGDENKGGVEVILPSKGTFKSESQAQFFTTAAMVLDNSKWKNNLGVNTIIETVYKILTEKRTLNGDDKKTVSTGILQLLLLTDKTDDINDENFFGLLREEAKQVIASQPKDSKSVHYVKAIFKTAEQDERTPGKVFYV